MMMDEDEPREYIVSISDKADQDMLGIIDFLDVLLEDEAITDGIVKEIQEGLQSLSYFPNRGSPREEIRPGLRLLVLRRPAIIAYEVDEERSQVTVACPVLRQARSSASVARQDRGR